MSRPAIVRLRTALTPFVREVRRQYLRRIYGVDLGRGVQISLTARIDKTNPRGVHIGEFTGVAFEAAILTHDAVNARHLDVRIGKNCLIGARSIILPGVTIGDHCIIAVAAVVMKDVPAGSVVSGNPGRVVETGILTGPLGRRLQPFGSTSGGQERP